MTVGCERVRPTRMAGDLARGQKGLLCTVRADGASCLF